MKGYIDRGLRRRHLWAVAWLFLLVGCGSNPIRSSVGDAGAGPDAGSVDGPPPVTDVASEPDAPGLPDAVTDDVEAGDDAPVPDDTGDDLTPVASSDAAVPTDTAVDSMPVAADGSADTTEDTSVPVGEIDFIKVVGAVDVVHDAKRGRVYVTDTGGAVTEYDLATRATIGQLKLSTGALRGIDLSPDGDRLLVADSVIDAKSNRIHLFDLVARMDRPIMFDLAFYESGTFMPVFIDDATALVTSTFAGSGWVPLRRVQLADGSAATIRSVTQNTMLTPSADRSGIAYAESNISNGPFGLYRPATGEFQTGETGRFVYEIGVSRLSDQYAVPTYSGLMIFDGQMKPVTMLGVYSDRAPVGVVYSPTSDRFYVAWADRSRMAPSIEGFDARSFKSIAAVENSRTFDWNGNFSFGGGGGRLRISHDGTLLFATVTGGVVVYRVQP